MIQISSLPAINATLNAVSAVLLTTGFILIRQRRRTAHKRVMLTACATSALFLICYLTYHYATGHTVFSGSGMIRVFYLTILIPHVFLAVVNVPMVIMTLRWAFKGQFDRHRRLARWTLSIWLYVSVTGVMVYWMLYRMNFSS